MAEHVLLWSMITLTASILSAAGSAYAVSKRASRSTRRASSLPPAPPTQISLQDFETLRAEVTSLSLGLEATRKSVKKLAGYKAVQDFREREAATEPAVGTPKDQLRRHYGIAGKNHIEVAKMAQMRLVADRDMQQE